MPQKKTYQQIGSQHKVTRQAIAKMKRPWRAYIRDLHRTWPHLSFYHLRQRIRFIESGNQRFAEDARDVLVG